MADSVQQTFNLVALLRQHLCLAGGVMLSVVNQKFQALGLVGVACESEDVEMSVEALASRVHRFALG